MRDLPLIACEAGTYKGFGILLDGRPPKLSLEEFKGVSSAWMAGQMRGVTPLENLGAKSFRDKQEVGWPPSWVWFPDLSLSYSSHLTG